MLDNFCWNRTILKKLRKNWKINRNPLGNSPKVLKEIKSIIPNVHTIARCRFHLNVQKEMGFFCHPGARAFGLSCPDATKISYSNPSPLSIKIIHFLISCIKGYMLANHKVFRFVFLLLWKKINFSGIPDRCACFCFLLEMNI